LILKRWFRGYDKEELDFSIKVFNHCRGKVAGRLMGEFVHQELREVSKCEGRFNYLSCGLGI
jgi:hypothetical protein